MYETITVNFNITCINFPNLCMFICYFRCYKLHQENNVHEDIEQDKSYSGFAEETWPV